MGAALLLLLNADMLQWAGILLSEMLFAATMVAALLAFDEFLVRWSADLEMSQGRALWVGAVFAAPVWVRYIGIVVPFLTATCLIALLMVSRKK